MFGKHTLATTHSKFAARRTLEEKHSEEKAAKSSAVKRSLSRWMLLLLLATTWGYGVEYEMKQ